MGFKRTSEGRVFFQGSDNTKNTRANDESTDVKANTSGMQASAIPPLHSQQTQAQILTLLKVLNERLKNTQTDREKMAKELEAYRALVEDLQTKTQRSERAYLELQQKISKGLSSAENNKAEILAQEALAELKITRQMLLDIEDKAMRADQSVVALKSEISETRKTENIIVSKQAALEKIAREQAEKFEQETTSYAELLRRLNDTEQKQEELGAKLELAGVEQARLVRKIDKAIEDRTRFMRKIERIEETVIQTRDSLNAKAMVLLTDQGLAGQSEFQDDLNAELAALQSQSGVLGISGAASLPAHETPKTNWWPLSRFQTLGLTGVIVFSLLAGWAINEMQKPNFQGFEKLNEISNSQNVQPLTTETSTAHTQTTDQPLNMQDQDWSISPEKTDTSSTASAGGITEKNNEQLSTDQQKQNVTNQGLSPSQDDIGMLDINDQEAIEKLLEGDIDAAAKALNTLEPSKPVADVQTPVLLAPEMQAPQINLPQPTLRNPADLIKPDSKLTANVKEIENQAFAGVPEAQHDLAAIYTAGHGGVDQDYKRAAFWFEQAADRGVANGAYNLGVLHHQGLGMKADIKKAIDWYLRAAALGHPEAQYNLGIAYIEGIGVAYDPVKAAQFFHQAANQNIMEAAYNLGLIYENGLLGEAKPDEALIWYKQASDQGSPEAKQALDQLAKSMNMKVEDVNRLVETLKKSKIPSSAQESSAADKSSSLNLTAQIQEYLMRVGLFSGPADGMAGSLTESAIRAYQKSHGLNQDGIATQGLLTHMLSNTETSAISPD